MTPVFRKVSYALLWMVCLGCLQSCQRAPIYPLQEERHENNTRDLYTLHTTAHLPERPLTLEDIVRIATERNLDVLVKHQEWEFQREIVTSEVLKMLPSMLLNSENSVRNNNLISTGETFPGKLPLPPEITVEKRTHRWDITATFDVLDFGIAFFRSQSQMGRALSSYFEYARLQQNLILDVYRAYWKAIANRYAADRSLAVLKEAKSLQNRVQVDMDARLISAIQGLRSIDQLVGVQIQLYNYEEEYWAAISQLAALMGLTQDIYFELAPAEINSNIGDYFDIPQLEAMAMQSRPELYGADADVRTTTNDVRAAVVSIFPNFQLFRGYNEDTDRFLLNHHWIQAGLRLAWNLLAIPQHIADVKAAKFHNMEAFTSRLAISVGVLSQVHLAYLKFRETLTIFRLQDERAGVRDRLFNAAKQEYYWGEFQELDTFSLEADALQSDIAAIQAYGDLQVAIEQVNNVIGNPLLFDGLPQPEVSESETSVNEEEECAA